jgi:hypothetical protein
MAAVNFQERPAMLTWTARAASRIGEHITEQGAHWALIALFVAFDANIYWRYLHCPRVSDSREKHHRAVHFQPTLAQASSSEIGRREVESCLL